MRNIKDKNPLLIAAGTLIFYVAALPLIDSLVSLAQTGIAQKISKIQYNLAQDQKETEEIADRINGSGCVQAIGFDIGNQEMEDEQ